MSSPHLIYLNQLALRQPERLQDPVADLLFATSTGDFAAAAAIARLLHDLYSHTKDGTIAHRLTEILAAVRGRRAAALAELEHEGLAVVRESNELGVSCEYAEVSYRYALTGQTSAPE